MGNSSRSDFNVLEVAGVKKDKQELIMVLEDMADHLPKEDSSKGTSMKCDIKRKFMIVHEIIILAVNKVIARSFLSLTIS